MKRNRGWIWLSCSAVFFLPSCTNKRVRVRQSTHNADSTRSFLDDTNNRDLLYQESLLVDIPFPLYDERIASAFKHEITDNASTVVLGYKSPLTPVEAIDFFMDQMERHGWKHLVTFQGPEYLLQFKAPGRYCTLVVRHDGGKGSTLYIYVFQNVTCG